MGSKPASAVCCAMVDMEMNRFCVSFFIFVIVSFGAMSQFSCQLVMLKYLEKLLIMKVLGFFVSIEGVVVL